MNRLRAPRLARPSPLSLWYRGGTEDDTRRILRAERDERLVRNDGHSPVVAEPVEDAASLAGIVTKFSAVHDGRRYVVKRRSNAGDYILKLPSTHHPDLVDNELTGYRLAGVINLDCAEVQHIPISEAEPAREGRLPKRAGHEAL